MCPCSDIDLPVDGRTIPLPWGRKGYKAANFQSFSSHNTYELITKILHTPKICIIFFPNMTKKWNNFY